MNIFYLDCCPAHAAKDHCDKHVVKMILEYAQLMSTAHHVLDGDKASPLLYKQTHKNHPSAVWTRQSRMNYTWLLHLWLCLLQEYTHRYGKQHKTSRLKPLLTRLPSGIPNGNFGEPPQCMPEEYKEASTVNAYRSYYRTAKASVAEWRYTPTPIWYEKGQDYATYSRS